ncbi:efflux RND transporter permease subunit [Rhodoblastus acidophilus]|uniref:Efflux RND transporter permease subunit n=1 Tax=Candidatus Rhodoblastus alkanivorans TaxID=2954117 RepID=A0ABS9ZAV0_9HYPH|nr:efflux RND transporter permease subunit [Candidatus Rhodoblastus alkanivorans]MCI4679343.1 efflux RND transporter permease subunit [Candidatus Rhodoblastus alkanivorans]MCI4684819.1 efflux RND transporter permease subunit [Candidatus Rhodoblastus alkanivorans]MDI4642143.1 efflux RND transporter permease subunit [Rhodoblastus acidophilus]
MGLVRFALRFPHTFYVLAALILFLGGIAIKTMPADIFPEIRIPVVTVIWQYTGLSTPEMEQRISTYSQYAISSNVNGIKNMEAQTLNGLSVQKIYFQPDVNLDLAIAQIIAGTSAIRSLMPAGVQPPIVVQFNASSVPVLQLSLSSNSMSEQQLYDYGIYRVRQGLAPVPGVTLPTPSGGKYRQIMVDIDPEKLAARGLTPLDVVNAVNAQNLTLPSGAAKLGDTQYVVRTNAMPSTIAGLNDIPIKSVNGAMVFVRDVGQVHDGWLAQQNIVREDGKRSVLLSIIKNGNASTLAVVNGVRQALKTLRAAAPPGLKIGELLDQSVFVREAVNGVVREGLIAGALTAVMILLFLRSWRSTLVVMVSIPLSILSSLIVLSALGHTLNTMTLGGLALAVGILVDDSTVTIENTHRLLTEEKKPLGYATLHGAAGIAVPTLVSTIAICCVFTSVVFLDGPAKYLFTPLGLAVVFAMLASYALSRTLTPVMIGLLLRHEKHEEGAPEGFFGRISHGFETRFESMRANYVELLQSLLAHRFVIPVAFVAILALAGVMFTLVGRDFFPAIDSGQIQLHVRAPAATRIEATEVLFQQVEDKIRQIIPAHERERIVDNIGLPARSYNLAFSDGSTIGANDGIIIVALKNGHAPTQDYVDKLRLVLHRDFPQAIFYFQPADMVTQILNFGLPAQIDIRTVGYDRANNLAVAKEIRDRLNATPGFADVHIQQETDAPALIASIDRSRAQLLGVNASTIANNLNVALSSSEQVSPNFWTDPKSGIPYFFAVQTPERKIASLDDLKNIPVTTTINARTDAPAPGLLSNVATFSRGTIATNANQSNIQPVYEVYASLQGVDLGTASRQLDKLVAELTPKFKPGNHIEVVGQIRSMRDSFRNLGIGLLFAAVLVYFLMVVNYQNFGDPFVVILALPATFAGILTMLFVTGSTLSVPSLMGAIMAVGVASANSILLVTFARERQLDGATSFEAAIEAGHTRIRPVLMTAAAMIVGMVPMAIGGPGEEQNAVLARAVIGGLLFATPTTLLIVPYLFAVLRRGNDGKPAHGVFPEAELT